jgi:hypothetical protein
MLSSLAASGLSYLSMNLMLKRSGLFQAGKKTDFSPLNNHLTYKVLKPPRLIILILNSPSLLEN